ncbi:hypothetical protein Bpfe_023293, partial [Biomphalaria pfeifferi]
SPDPGSIRKVHVRMSPHNPLVPEMRIHQIHQYSFSIWNVLARMGSHNPQVPEMRKKNLFISVHFSTFQRNGAIHLSAFNFQNLKEL